jgi:DNA-binding XRE family transcriptional regulator
MAAGVNGATANGTPDGETHDGTMAITPASLRTLRESLGLTQAQAARGIGVSRGLLAEAERGRRNGERTLARIALGLRELAAHHATPVAST